MGTEPKQVRVLPSALRSVLVGTGIAAAAVVGSLLLGAAPAQAAEQPSGLGSLVGEVTDLTGSVSSGVGDVLESAPVSAITAPVLQTVDHIVVQTVQSVPVAGPIVTETVGSTPTSSVIAPVAGLLDETLGATGKVVDGAGGVIDGLPPVIGLPDSGTPVTGVPDVEGISIGASPVALDHAAALAARTAVGPVRDASPTFEVEALAPAADTADAAPIVVASPLSPEGPHSPLGSDRTLIATAGSTSSGGASTPLTAPADTTQAAIPASPSVSTASLPTDDDLPSSAVHDTDSSPD